MPKYLYGASIHGIQSFIFQTNKLTEIIGASELVEQICTSFFKKQVGIDFKDENLILGAAGNVKYLFDDEASCQNLVRKFPKDVMELAPGITISQAVIVVNDERKLVSAIQRLEECLKTQRNKVGLPHEIGFMSVERSRRTGGVAFENNKNKYHKQSEVICEATLLKRNNVEHKGLFSKMTGKPKNEISEALLAYNIDDIAIQGGSSWIAVMHADGNGLGAILQNLGKSFESKTDDQVKIAYRRFSVALEESTKAAAKFAYESIKDRFKGSRRFPIRPILIGGDDITIILRADLAIDFTTNFLQKFEMETKVKMQFLLQDFDVEGFEEGITACAGIAFIKSSYPFHYAINLSEKLCKQAKEFVKGLPDAGKVPLSSLAFHKVQDSFIESKLIDIQERSLMAGGINFNYGPYLIHPKNGYASIKELNEGLAILESKSTANDKSKGVSKLRQWISELYVNKETAAFMLDRLKDIDFKFYEDLKLDKERRILTNDKPDSLAKKSIIYHLVQLHTLSN